MVKKALLGQVSDSDIRLLKIFRTVVECGGLSAAELELNIGRSTVSRHVKDLEERLGLVLCRRGRGGFALTPEGQRVYQGALQLLGAMDAFRTGVGDLHAELVGTLGLGLFDKTVSNPDARIADAVRLFRRQAPQVALDVTIGTLNDLEAGVIDGQLAIAIVPDHRRSDSLDYLPLFGEAMHLYCGQRHPLFGVGEQAREWDAVRDCDYAGLAFHSPNMEAAHRFGLRRRASVTDQEGVATLILSGCYVGFLPGHYAGPFVQAGSMRRIGPDDCGYAVQFVAIMRRAPAPSRAACAFRDALAAAHA
ncbi:MAG: LysR family transcriptional regulator [Pseudomonadota bacterium]